MARAIDEKIVKLSLEDGDFKQRAKNAGDTLKNLFSKFKGEEVDVKKPVDALQSINREADNASRGGMSRLKESVSNLISKYPSLQTVATGALLKIGSMATQIGSNLMNSLMIQPPKMGFEEYENKMNSTQVIISNTGESIDHVNKILEEMNKYSDDTIYSFEDMTRNMGTFTAAGVKLDDAAVAIKGISNLAAVSGSNTQQAGQAMYQLSQALSTGKVGLQDWNSVVNAGMGGQKFQTALQATADKLGIARDKTKSFRDSLQDGWLTSEVLLNTLKDFAKDESMLEAATKVRTFSQLMDTTKEAIQSGWAQTWEIIFGNYEESGEMWSGIAKSMAPFIDGMSQSRNNMLKFLKDAGVFKQIGAIIKNVFSTIINILGAAKKPFTEIGDAIKKTGKLSKESIGDVLKPIVDFTNKLKDNKRLLNAVTTAVRALLSPLKLVGPALEILRAVFDKIKSVIPTEKFKELKSAIKDIASGVMDRVNAIFKSFGDSLPGTTKNIVEFIKSLDITPISNFFTGIIDFISDFAKRFKDSPMKKMSGDVTKLGDSLKASGISDRLRDIRDGAKDVASNGLPKLKQLVKFIKDNLLNKGTIVSGTLIGSAILGIRSFRKVTKSLTGFIDSLKDRADPMKSVKGLLDNIGKGIKSLSKNFERATKAAIIVGFALAIGVLALSLVELTKVDTKKLLIATATLSAFVFVLKKVLESGNVKFKNAAAMSGTMIALGGALLLIAASAKIFASIDPDSLTRSLSAMAISLGGMLVIVGIANKLKLRPSGMTGLILVAGAMLMIGAAAKIFSSIDADRLKTGLLGMAAALTGVLAITGVANKMKLNPSTSLGLVAVAAGMVVLGKAVQVFASMNVDELKRGLLGAGAAMLEIAIFAKLVNKTKIKVSTGIALTTLALGLAAIAIPLKILGSMDTDTLIQGLTVVGGILAGFAVFSRIVKPSGLFKTAVSLGVMALALTALVAPIMLLGRMDTGQLVQGGVALAGITGVLALLGALSSKLGSGGGLIVLGAGITAVGLGMIVLSKPLIEFGKMKLEDIGKGLLVLAGALAILLAAGALALPVSGGLLALSISMLAIGGGVALLAIGIKLLGEAIMYIAEIGPPAIEGLKNTLVAFLEGLTELLPAAEDFLIQLIQSVCNVLVEGFPVIIQTALTLILQLLTAMRDNIGPIVTVAADLVINFINALAEKTPDIVMAAFNFIVVFIQGLADAIAENQEALRTAIWSLLKAIFDLVVGIFGDILGFLFGWVPQFWDEVVAWVSGVWNKITEWWSGLAEHVGGFFNAAKDKVAGIGESIKETVSNFAKGAKEKLTTAWSDLKDKASTAWEKVKTGISNAKSGAGEAARGVANWAKDRFKDAANLYQAGKDMIQGAINGVRDKAGELWNAVSNAASDAWAGFKKAIKSNSPSKLFKQGGNWMMEGAKIGVEQQSGAFIGAVRDSAEESVETFTGIAQTINDEFGNVIDTAPTITPEIDMEAIQNAQNNMQNLSLGKLDATSKTSFDISARLSALMKDLKESDNHAINKLNDIASYLDAILNKDQSIYMDSREIGELVAQPVSDAQAQQEQLLNAIYGKGF